MSPLHLSFRTRVRSSRCGHPPARRCGLRVEDLERRLALSTGQGSAIPDGVDSLALADVNGDRLVDVVVAGRVSGANEIQIEDGRGWPDKGDVSSSTVNILDTLDGKQVPDAGHLAVAAGDFADKGVSDVAVTSDQTQTVTVYQFHVQPSPAPPGTKAVNTVLDAQVSPSTLGSPFTPPDMAGATGLTLAAADFDQDGADELVVGPAGAGPDLLDIMKYDPTTRAWQLESQVDLTAVGITGGVSLSAGDLVGDGKPVIAVASSTTGEVAVYDPSSQSWIATISPPAGQVGGVRVAVVVNDQAPGALVTTPDSGTGQPVLIPATTWAPQPFAPSSSFDAGGGALVPLGGGWVYPKSTMMTKSPGTPKLPYSPGPVAPTVLLGSTRSDQLLVQGFLATPPGMSGPAYSPNSSPLDTFTEPVLAASVQKQSGFTPLEEPGDMPGVPAIAAAAVVAYPPIAYHSPYSINLANSLPGITRGLLTWKPFRKATKTAWGPFLKANKPPKVATGQGAAWLQQRLLTVYRQAIGLTYQHHHNPLWNPAQGSPWNVVSIGSQGRGVDCTNLTAFAYADALGIWMSGKTTVQAGIGITPGWQNPKSRAITIPSTLGGLVHVHILKPPAVRDQTTYQTFVNSLQPGNILFINSKLTAGKQPNPAGCVHAITYLGSYGSQDGNSNPDLIIDSTGNAPPHFDSNGKIIPAGVQIRPFGAPESLNEWYFLHVDHVLRLIVPPTTQAPTGGSSNA